MNHKEDKALNGILIWLLVMITFMCIASRCYRQPNSEHNIPKAQIIERGYNDVQEN
jgi:hypothetical protein